jgi:hypothetical protein
MRTVGRRVPLLLLVATALASGCDDDAGVEEVDRGAKPIEARRGVDAARRLVAAEPAAGVELEHVQVLATATVDDTSVAMLADEDGTVTCAAIGRAGALQWLDVDALGEGRLAVLEGRPADIEADAATLLDAALARRGR